MFFVFLALIGFVLPKIVLVSIGIKLPDSARSTSSARIANLRRD